MQNNTLIYVAGNPDLYPLEYYDAQAQDYRGAIPELLAGFAADYGCEIVYYQPGADDERSHLAENLQVDVVSGVVSGERFAGSTGALTLFQADIAGDTVEYGVVFTQTAPEEFVRALTSYVSERSQSAVTGELLAAAGTQPAEAVNAALPAAVALGCGLCIALAVLFAAIRRGKRRIRGLERERETDPCTGLYNQLGLERAFRETVNDKNRSLYYMLCFRFELGHIERLGGPGTTASFQRYAADVLRRSAPTGQIMARGDNGEYFALYQAKSEEAARDWALRVLEDVKAYSGSVTALSHRDAAAGVFPLSARACGYEQVLYHARQCAISAGRSGQSVKICGADNCRICQEERELLEDLEHGLEFGEFQLNLQFIVSAKDFEIVGGEALSRWMHPRKGLLNPDRYVPLLEKEDRIERLDFYNLDRACSFLEQLHKVYKRDFFISCNLSRRSFVQEDLVKHCKKTVERYDFPRRELILEITESGYICSEEISQMRENIRAVRELGVQVMLDDFGMGYTTFHDLLEFPMDGVKLDKSLVDNMGTEQGKIVLDGIVRTGHKLGLTVLAEGVEEEWQVDELSRLNCDLLQGYHFSVPVPAAEALSRLSGQART